MKIGLISDTHGYLDSKIYEHFNECDEVWHAGDIGSLDLIDQLRKFKPCRIVYGNIDDHQVRIDTAEYLAFECEGVKVLITHIAGKPGKYVRRAHELIEEYKPQLFICGHSHILLVKNDPYYNMLWMNPGAYGIKGFHQVRTALRFEINAGQISNLEVIEMKMRA